MSVHARSPRAIRLLLIATVTMFACLAPLGAAELDPVTFPLNARTVLGTAATSCDGIGDGTWNGCRGTGCHVCQEKLAGYDCYFQNHPECTLNTTCDGRFYDCDAACPAPTEADRCSGGCVADVCSGSCSRPAIGVDNDGDQVPDRLEYDLAYDYFPNIWLQHYGDDLAQTYVYNDRAIPFTVQPLSPTGVCNESFECLEIRYGLAYFYDTGDPTWGGSHLGDSEMYAALVQRTDAWSIASGNAGSWRMIRDFTAAHWRATADSSRIGEYGYCPPYCRQWDDDGTACIDSGRCAYFPGQCFGFEDAEGWPCSFYYDEWSCFWAGGDCYWVPPVCSVPSSVGCYASSPRTTRWTTYAAEGKHALYHTDSECDGGGVCVLFFGCSDECPSNSYNMRSYISGLLQNVGDTSNVAYTDTTIQDPDACTLYDVWSGDSFGEATSYREHFLYPLYWDLP